MTDTTIPFVDLKAQYQSIKKEIEAAIGRVFESTQFILGDEVAAFEQEFASYCETDFGIAVNSGTSALHLALLAAGVGPGDEVVTVPFTFVATVAAICYTGARPVLVDISPDSHTMDPKTLERAITDRTKVILPVHLFGQAADMDPILEIARRHHLMVIEDAAQAHGALYKGRRTGSMGDMACFSFYPGKNLGAYGEGGMVVTRNPELTKTLRMLRDWGQEKRYYHKLRGFNYRMDGLQGAILRVKLGHLEEWTEARRSRARLYDRLLSGLAVETPVEMSYSRHVYHLYAIRTDRRDALYEALQEAGIQVGIHYPVPVHLQEAYADLGYGPGDFPEAERVAGRILSLPVYPELSETAVNRIADCIRGFEG